MDSTVVSEQRKTWVGLDSLAASMWCFSQSKNMLVKANWKLQVLKRPGTWIWQWHKKSLESTVCDVLLCMVNEYLPQQIIFSTWAYGINGGTMAPLYKLLESPFAFVTLKADFTLFLMSASAVRPLYNSHRSGVQPYGGCWHQWAAVSEMTDNRCVALYVTAPLWLH